jgi:endonuclease/exonuclease/phosphatase (EEP) superfamily protein YafD
MVVLKRFLRICLVLTAGGLILLLVAGYAAALHPVGDSLAVFRAQGAAALLATAAFALSVGLRRLAGISVVIVVVTGAPLIRAYAQTGTPGSLTLYQKNLLFQNDDLASLATDITRTRPDFITLQEVSTSNRRLLAALATDYQTLQFCTTTGVGGTAVLSRFPAVPGTATCAFRFAAVQVETDAGAVWAISIHLYWPWPYRQAPQVDELVPRIAALAGPKIIAGDFNMVPWSRNMRRIAVAGEVQFAQPIRGSYPAFGPALTLPIDHVLTPMGGVTSLRPLLGSDHHGLLVQFDLP